MQNFIVQHALLGTIAPNITSPQRSSLGPLESPFRLEMKNKLAKLGQIEKNRTDFKLIRSRLEALRDENQDQVTIFISSIETPGIISRSFISSIIALGEKSNFADTKQAELRKIVEEELSRLQNKISGLDKKIMERESETTELIKIENKFQELSMEVEKKLIVFEGLKAQLDKRILEAGLEKINQPVLLAEAVPPIFPSTPNKKLILVFGVLIFSTVGILYIFIRQSFLRKIYTISQIRRISRTLNAYQINLNHLKKENRKIDNPIFSQPFFGKLSTCGQVGCVIDISREKFSINSVSTLVSVCLGNMLSEKSLNVICLNPALKTQAPIPFSQIAKSSNLNPTLGESRPTILEDKNGFIESANFSGLKKEFSSFDKILCSLGSNVTSMKIFEMLDKCDFYVLIGKVAQIDEHTLKNFSNETLEREKKCLGLFLIN